MSLPAGSNGLRNDAAVESATHRPDVPATGLRRDRASPAGMHRATTIGGHAIWAPTRNGEAHGSHRSTFRRPPRREAPMRATAHATWTPHSWTVATNAEAPFRGAGATVPASLSTPQTRWPARTPSASVMEASFPKRLTTLFGITHPVVCSDVSQVAVPLDRARVGGRRARHFGQRAACNPRGPAAQSSACAN
ncbi:hypothetical protein NOV72_01832 [Caballeronia novacaledonica]|uniref:Uncharacterized protein n=1 Tax=Caballeronia novacaledonica TaxID=1544861 RepID=A0A2U3I3E9_9BURK|nr:hypothetical protein NOV72_01832 [Caballeronia novacaledonica]